MLNVFPSQIPVRAGDVIGAYYAQDDPCGATSPGYGTHEVDGDAPLGSTASYDTFAFQLDLAAVLEPDCDKDGFGDETQDPSAACPRTLTLDASKSKVKRGGKVTLTGRIAETGQNGACAANQPVELQRKKPSQSAFTTVEQLQTDPAGAFSAKEKVKKTFEYRAQAAETATCAAGISNTEKVKAKKK